MDNLDSILDKETLDSFDPELRKSYELHDEVRSEKNRSKVRISKSNILLSGDATFATLQGEGPTLGLPCVFCRLHVCNLRCSWCDAFYTWNPNSEEFWTESIRTSFIECATRIEDTWNAKFPNSVERRVIWSGGEPLIQKTQIDQVMAILDDNLIDPLNLWVMEIETNGTLMPTQEQLIAAQFNCSPKLNNSANHHHSMVKPKVLNALNEADTVFKFVCRDEWDLREIEEKYLPYISEDKVIIMPEGIVEEEITKHARTLYEPVMKRGWRMTPRFQAIFAEGARRRV